VLCFGLRDALNALRMSIGVKVPLTFTAFHQVTGICLNITGVAFPEYY